LGIGRGGQPPAREEEGTAQGSREAPGVGSREVGSEPARSSCGGGSLEAAQHSRTGEQGRPGGGATAGEPAAGDRRSTVGEPTLDGRQGRGTESLARLASASPVACRLRLAVAERRRVER